MIKATGNLPIQHAWKKSTTISTAKWKQQQYQLQNIKQPVKRRNMNVHQMNERVLPMWTESDKQNKTEENRKKIAHLLNIPGNIRVFLLWFYGDGFDYRCHFVMSFRHIAYMRYHFGKVIFFFVPIWFWLFICIWTERKREVLRNRFISPKSMNKRRRKKSTITNRSTVSPFNFNANFWQNKKIHVQIPMTFMKWVCIFVHI